jgi:hypothetical protein
MEAKHVSGTDGSQVGHDRGAPVARSWHRGWTIPVHLVQPWGGLLALPTNPKRVGVVQAVLGSTLSQVLERSRALIDEYEDRLAELANEDTQPGGQHFIRRVAGEHPVVIDDQDLPTSKGGR